MPFQNRVTPEGVLVRTSARGTLTGNRGILHDENQQTRRTPRGRLWIACLLVFKDRKRPIMQPGRYTELFFLDEATAFAAGHRPCWECRRADAIAFKSAWLAGNPELGLDASARAPQIDAVLHTERIDANRQKVVYRDRIDLLPDGAFVRFASASHLVHGDWLYQWSPDGYTTRTTRPQNIEVDVLTPRSIVRAFRAGYSAGIHETAYGK